MKKSLAIIAAFGLVPTAAFAANDDLAINHSDLDLSRKSDVKKLERRIAAAAARYCRTDASQTGSRIVGGSSKECAREFKADAMKQFAVLLENERKGG